MPGYVRRLFADATFLVSLICTVLFLATGMVMLFKGWVEMGWVLFGLLPVLLGIPAGLSRKSSIVFSAVLIGLSVILFLLYIMGFSGLICIVMIMPLVVPLLLVGMVIGIMIRRVNAIKQESQLSLFFFPFLAFLIAAPVEKAIDNNSPEVIEVKTSRVYNYSAGEVFDAIKSVDTLDVEKSFLMNFDLPVPTKCILEKEAVGAKRTCYFDNGNFSFDDFGGGTITEEVTEIERGKVLRMKVVNYELVGRKWIGFRDAIYYFESLGEHQCRLTRVTTYTSVLKPRLYWEPLEKLSIEEEHDYVLDNLQKDLDDNALTVK